MIIIAAGVGCFFLFCISCLILAYAHNIVQERREGYRERQFHKAIAVAKVELGRRFIHESYWLLPEHAKVMHLLGKKFLEHGGYNISDFRQELETYELHKS